ncbi:MAG: uroporphyrinogen-III C-methyltransferase [Flavobacteriaceae bacterium]
MQPKKSPKFTLIGAGPGDPDLLTLKGCRALMDADVVLYDALVNTRLLKHVPKATICVFVGKRKGFQQYSQQKINKLIVEYALANNHVVRLKGGDPFVFGRGGEELEYARTFGINCEVVPGISSSIGVPALQGIPLTKRGVSESFWVLTGSTSANKLSDDIALAIQSRATLVLLMGMSRLPEIVRLFKAHGKGCWAAAIIEKGTFANERVGLGTIDSILEVVKEKNLSAPAVIIIGEVVKHRIPLKPFYEHLNQQS